MRRDGRGLQSSQSAPRAKGREVEMWTPFLPSVTSEALSAPDFHMDKMEGL